jgi:hypothetical protein
MRQKQKHANTTSRHTLHTRGKHKQYDDKSSDIQKNYIASNWQTEVQKPSVAAQALHMMTSAATSSSGTQTCCRINVYAIHIAKLPP